MDELEKEMIPENLHGIASDTEFEKTLASEEEAIELFNNAKFRLLHPNQWHTYAGKATADFQLTNEKGDPVENEAREGYHFRIDIPGPGSSSGEGYDWVRVEKIKEVENGSEKNLIIQVRPATNPLNEKKDVAHFFSEEATSTFMVTMKGKTVKASVFGRNEKPNTEAESFTDIARNTAIATGAIGGFAKLQWKSLVKGLLE